MITGVSHTGIVVKDMDIIVAFYRDVFGFVVVLDRTVKGKESDGIVGFHVEDERIVSMQLGDKQVEFLHYQPGGRSYPEDYRSNDLFGMHLALQTDDMERDYAMLKKRGVKIISQGPQTIKDHTIFAGTKVLYFQDPEGHPLELIQLP